MKLPDQIETARLRIRPLRADDADAFVAFMTDAETTTEFMFEAKHKTPDGARAFFEAATSSYQTEAPYFVCAIDVEGCDGFAGMCGISGLPEGEMEPWVCLAPAHRAHGYATEAVRSLIEYCFARYPVEVFRACISPRNPASVALARRMGMEYEGRGTHPVHGDESEVFVLSRTPK